MNKFQKVLAVMLAASMSLAGPMAARADAPDVAFAENERASMNTLDEMYLPDEIVLTEETELSDEILYLEEEISDEILFSEEEPSDETRLSENEFLPDEIWILEEDMPDEELTEEEEVLLADEIDLPEEMTPSGEDATTLPVWEEDLEESPNAAEPDAEENGEEISQETEVPTPSFIPLSSYDFDQFEVVMHLKYLEEGEEISLPSRRLLSASPSQVGKQGYLTFKTDKIYYGGEWNGALVQPFNVNVDGTDYLAFCAASWMSAPEFDTSYTVVEIDVPTADMMKVAFLAGYNGACAEEYADAVYGILHNEKFMGWTHSLISYLDTGDFRTYPSGTNVYYDWEEEAILAATENIEYLLATDQELQKVVRRTHLYGTKPYEGDDGSSQPVYWIAVDTDMPTGLLRAKKVSGNTVLTEENPCYDFSGIQFKVYTDEACSAEALDADGEPILLISQADGLTDYVSVEPGTYYVQEVEESLTGKGWKYNPDPTQVVVPEDGAEEALIAEVENQPLNDPLGIEITKIAKDPAYAVADLSNAEYTIQYYAGQYTIDTLPAEADATWVVKTVKVGEHYIAALHDTYMVQGEAVFGKDASGQYVLPLGTITIKETKAPAGFSLKGSTIQLTGGDGSDSADERVLYNFIDDQGVCSVQSGNQILSAEDGVKVESLEENARGDLSFTKKLVKTDGTEEPLGGIPFVITSQKTGESHYVVTDANGVFSSAAVSPEKLHTTNTNGYDDILKPYDDADQVIPTSVIENLSYAGIWFGAEPVDDTKGALPLGTYEVRELKTEANKDLDMVTKTFEVTEENTVADDEILNPEIPSSTLSVKKVSAAADLTAENDSYDFSGIQFKVYTDNACHTEAKKKDGGEILLTSDKNGETESIFMEPGTYYVQEVEESLTGKGWIYNANPTEVVIPERGHAKALVAEISNKPMHSAGIQIIKVDESGAVSDGSDLSGAEYTINFYKGQYTKDNRPEVADATWVIQTIKDGDDYIAELDDEHLVSGKAVYGIMEDGRFILPLGTITIEETKAPEGFTTEGATIRLTDGDGTDETDGVVLYNFVDRDGTCHVVSGNQAVPAGNGSSFTSKDSFKRGELTFTKKILGTERTMAGIPFKIKNVETQETHYVVTDANGVFSSAVKLPDVLHTTNTNGYDDILKPYDDADQVIPASVIANLDPAGVWFGDAEVNDAFCSMPVGYYEVTELKTDANKTMVMVTKTFEVEEGPSVTDGGVIYNVDVKLHTTALDADSMTHYALAEERNVIIDTVYYENVEVGQTYTLTATAMVTENGTSRELEGFLGKKTFTAESENGSVEVRIVFDASDLAGKTITVYEEMRLDDGKEDGKGTFVAEHKELSDENQKIYYPGIQTNAKDADTNVGLANADTDITITDTVSYKNLNTDKRYILSGMLVDKATEYPILDDSGNPVTASKEFRPESSDGEVELTFTFQGASLAGTTAVVFEELKNAGKTFAVHADIDDEAQTVYIPKIHTMAVNKNTGIKTNECGETVLVDTVAYTNLLPFKTYTLKAKVYDKTTGELTDFTGEKTFTTSESTGTVDVEISLNTEGYEGHTFVAYETAFYGEVQIADHSEPDDEKQTTVVPKIGTVAKDTQTEIQLAALGETTFIDTVSYENLVAGEEYTMKASLFDKTEGKLTEYTGETIFTAVEGGSGTVDVEIALDTTNLAGHDLVCYEDGYYKEVLVASHKDKDDEGQTIHMAEIGTVAVNKETNIKTNALGETVVADTVEYKNLIPGKAYTLKATIYDRTSDELTDFTGEAEFTPEEANGTVCVEIQVDTLGLEGHDLVAYEKAYYGEVLIADHEEADDEKQTTEVSKIGTVAKDVQTEMQLATLGKTTFIDTVSYENLVAGETYVMKASLYDKTKGELTSYTGEQEFVAAEGSKGTVDVEIKLDTTGLAGHDLVCYENAYYKEVLVESHENPDDEGQTIHVGEIATKAVNKETNIKTNALGETVIVDTVEYKNFILGKTYTLKASIYDATSGELTDFTGEKEFTPEAKDGSVDVEIKVNTLGLEGHDLVAYEKAYYGEVLIADHSEPEDEKQTTEVAKIGTVAKDAQTEMQLAALDETTFIDTVSYENLVAGETYVMKASLFDKTKGELTSFIGEQEFVAAEGGKGTVDVEISVNTFGLAGHDLVCYENVYYKEVLVESHESPDDEGQTIHVAEIGTEAVNKETNIKTNALGETVIVDTVEYKNLIPGKTYTLKASIYDATSGELTDFTGEQEFTPESADGSVDVEITVNTLGLEGHDLVAFEEAYYGEVLIADHSEPEDEKQTTEVAKIGTVAKDAQTEM
ncbi:MAG: VaFE repeat-containing surface-anchored protein, partial [Lachnospiraceae bacterium]|nr:VaFE repeat-containing surface-anchored protein [Lachnospiraceae bacterium]